MKRINNIVFISMILIFLSFGLLTLFISERDISLIENRNLYKFKKFRIVDYVNGSYQTSLENALLDQVLYSEEIKRFMNNKLSFSNKLKNKECKDSYVALGEDLYKYNCEDYIVNKSAIYKEYKEEKWFKDTSEVYSYLNNNFDMYYYFVTTSANFDFTNNKMGIDVPSLINKYWMGNYSLDYLKINSYNDFKKYFYKTDHHWNYEGSYRGYTDIAKMMNKTDILIPIDEIKFNFNFYGTRSRVLSLYNIEESFTVYKYNLPNYKSYINGVEKKYGYEEDYFNGNYNTDKLEKHYHKFYGYDRGETILDAINEETENLLILSNSYSHPVNKLLASHFDKTYIIDLRHYEDENNKKFDIIQYTKEHNINKVLILMYIWYVSSLLDDLDI